MTQIIAERETLSDRTVSAAQLLLAGKRGGLHGYLAFAGPAVVASIAYMDPGNFATNIQAGAKYGYTLLWVVLAANLIAMLYQALSAKLGIVTFVTATAGMIVVLLLNIFLILQTFGVPIPGVPAGS